MVPKDCTGENDAHSNSGGDPTENSSISSCSGTSIGGGGSGGGHHTNRDSFYRDEFDDSDLDDGCTPTVFSHYNNHHHQQTTSNGGGGGGASAAAAMTAADLDMDSLDERRPSTVTVSPSANIPLMRIVQSVKHTKRRSGQAIKEGWLVHFTNKDKPVRRHYWRLDSKAITMFVSDQGSKYYKEIPLNEVLTVDTARNLSGNEAHCFQIRTPNIDYYVGQDPLLAYKVGEPLVLPPPDSGIGAHLAKSWETAIRQALMPVTSNRKFSFGQKLGGLHNPSRIMGGGDILFSLLLIIHLHVWYLNNLYTKKKTK